MAQLQPQSPQPPISLTHLGGRLPVQDSRKVTPGDTFIAITGEITDGHQYIDAAIQKGAVRVIAEPGKLPQNWTAPQGVEFVANADSLKTYRALAHEHRSRFKIPVIAVVGAVGKTTTKELIAALSRGRYAHVHKTEGSQNGFLGIPMTLFGLSAETQVAVIEIGIDDIGAMVDHMRVVNPTHVICTLNGPEHLHQLKTVDIAAEEELKAFDFARDNGRFIAVNLNDSYTRAWWSIHHDQFPALRAVTYSSEVTDYATYTRFYPASDSSHVQTQTLQIHGPGLDVVLTCPLMGDHHAQNLLAAVAVTHAGLGLSAEEMARGLITYQEQFGRNAIKTHDATGAILIHDYYNANPTSMRAGLDLLRGEAKKSGRPAIAVLGDMLELGDDEIHYHEELADAIDGIPHIYLYGPRMRALAARLKSALHSDDLKNIADHIKRHLPQKPVVLIKGSRGMRLETLLPLLDQ